MDSVIISRSLFGSSLAFHIIFATLGVGIPFMILIVEILRKITGDEDYGVMAKRWTKGFAVLLGVAIPSGTIVGVQMNLLWPGFMELVGQTIALPFQIEIYAFFLEAIFMSIYVYAADRLSPNIRIITVFFVALGASASAVLITAANTFMNTPAGFTYENGEIIDVDPWAAFFNPSYVTSAIHVLLSALMTGAFAITSVAAYKLLKTRNKPREAIFHYKAFILSLIIGGIMSLGTAVNGHQAAQELHQYQPEKLAAAEGLFESQTNAPLVLGGFADPKTHTVKYGIEIPGMLSLLAGNSFDEYVRGLYEFPEENWPPLYTHTLFNIMVGIGTFLIFLVGFVFVVYFVRKKKGLPRWLFRLLVLVGPLSMLGIEAGWVFSCSGRQPWTVYHIQRVEDAATASANTMLLVLFLSLYLLLAIIVVIVLLAYFKRKPLANDLNRVKRKGLET